MVAILAKNGIFRHFLAKNTKFKKNTAKIGKTLSWKILEIKFRNFSRKAFFLFFGQFFGISCFLQKNSAKIQFFAKNATILGEKMGKTQNFKNSSIQKFYLLGNFIFPNCGVNMTIFEEEDRFFVIFWFFGKNRNFFRF